MGDILIKTGVKTKGIQTKEDLWEPENKPAKFMNILNDIS